MENDQIIIPEGWTYFAHRTNTERWQEVPFDEQSIIVSRLMSAITEWDVYQEVRHYGTSHLQGYNIGNGIPFEIRCLICGLPYLRTMNNDCDIKNIMLKEFYYDRHNFGGCYGQRHPSIPEGEELIVIGFGEYDEVYDQHKRILWTIPKRFLEFYKNDIEKGKNRTISLKLPNCEHKKK